MIAVKLFALFSVVSAALAVPVLAANWKPLPDTGQTKCYDVSGYEIACPAAGQSLHGQDAQYHGPAPSYTDNGNGTITDNNTGLVWQQNTADTNNDGQITYHDSGTSSGYGDRLTWQDAVDYCTGLSFAGEADWRMPSFTELDSIVYYDRYTPTINPVFLCESNYYWSATTFANNADLAWMINFVYGYDGIDGKTDHYYVRCVRGGL